METPELQRTRYGPAKYSAFLLVLSRWLRLFASKEIYRYVTLGGTELRCIQTLHFIDPGLTHLACSFEAIPSRYKHALERAALLTGSGIHVTVSQGSIYSYERAGEEPHIFYLDLEGIFAWADHHERFGDMLQAGTIREGDVLFVTSHLGHNPGWGKVFETFDDEFRFLRVTSAAEKKLLYKRAHPSFTIYRALQYSGTTSDLSVSCFGAVAYKGTSPMGVYGFKFEEGGTDFASLVSDASGSFLDLKNTFALGI